jgi:short subunit dehydrogenase-like uncharacterized protein
LDYLDITGEQSFVKNSYDLKDNKACLIHSCSFESAFVDLLSFKYLKQDASYEHIYSLYQFDSVGPSPGTRFTMKVHSFFDQYKVSGGVLEKYHRPFALKNLVLKEGNFSAALSTPYPEVLFLHRRFNADTVASFAMMDESMVDFAIGKDEDTSRSLEQVIAKNQKMSVAGPILEERKEQGFHIYLLGKEKNGQETKVFLKGHDMYALTASLIHAALTTLLKEDFPKGVVMSPGEAFFKHGILEEVMKQHNLKVEVIS